MDAIDNVLCPKDMAVGMKVTICEWIDSTDHSWTGEPMEILAICSPYIAVRLLQTGETMSIDLRRAALLRISSEYVAAVLDK
jgi:hypothetical protein